MTPNSSADHAPKRDYPAGALAAVGAMLALGFVYPSASYAAYGILAMSIVGICLLVCMALMPGRPRTVEFLAASWAIFWVLMRMRAPIASAGRYDVGTAVMEASVFLVVYRATSSLGAPDRARRIALFVIAGGLVIACLHGIAQVYGPAWLPGSFRAQERAILESYPENDPLRAALLHAVGVSRRAVGTLGAPNIFASCCVCGVILCAAGAVMRRGALRIAASSGALICVIALLLTESRGGVLALLAGVAAMAALLFTWRLNRRQTVALLSFSGLAVAVVLVVLVAFIAKGNMTGRWLGATGMTVRFQYWQTALSMFRESPLLGLGPGAYEVRYPQFRVPGADETRHAHSVLFQYAATGGMVAVGLFAAFLIAVAASSWRNICAAKDREDYSEFVALCGITAASAAVLAHGMLEYTFDFRETALLFFALCGLVAAREAGAAKLSGNLFRAIPFLAVIALLIPCEIAAKAMARADAAREDAAAYLQDDASRQLALDAYQRAISSDPSDPVNWELLGRLKQSLGLPYARRDIEHASELNPYSAHLHELLALMSAEERDWPEALAEQHAAVGLHPLDAHHHLNLALLLLRSGDSVGARAEFDAAMKLRLIGGEDAQLRDDVERELQSSGH
ncbi:hypothetical protein BH09SUM1_BH09SUM1_32630 [soil metagenome]